MARSYYYYQALRKTIIQFLDTFNNIQIKRYKSDNTFDKYVTVPIKFAPKERTWYAINEKKDEEVLPMMSCTMNNIEFASDRAASRNHSLTKSTSIDSGTIQRFLNPVPYDLNFSITLWSKYMTDIDQVLEQILAYFAPHIFIRINIPEIDFGFDVKVVSQGASGEFDNEYDDENRRVLKYNLEFQVQTYLFRPVEDVKLVKEIYVNYFLNDETWKTRGGVGGLSTTFTSAASGESQKFKSQEPWHDADGNAIYNYEIFQFSNKIGSTITYND